jgi:hypothetical protein
MGTAPQLVVHAYVLMPNHHHLLLRTPTANGSAALQWVNVSFATCCKTGTRRSCPGKVAGHAMAG